MKGKLRVVNGFWFIETLQGKPIKLHTKHGASSEENEFTWNGSIYRDGDEVPFETENVYIPPPDDSIHCNRGDDVPHAAIQDEWSRIFDAFTKTQEEFPQDGLTIAFRTYIEENFYPPIRKPRN